MKIEKDTYSYVAGCILGGALGDAMGAETEFLSIEQIHERFGEHGIKEPPDPALYTDDTFMTLRVARGLVDFFEKGAMDEEDLGLCVANQLVLWLKEDPNRANGNSCMAGARALSHGKPWRDAGVPNGKGCGTAMRSAPYGLLLDETWARIAGAEHALMTHKSDVAMAAGAAVAAGVEAARDGEPEDVADAMMLAAAHYDAMTADMLNEAVEFEAAGHEVSKILDRWRGWTGDEAAAASLFIFLRSPDDYVRAMQYAVNSPGDSDSLGSIAGNLVGAYLGVEKVPDEWIQRLENKDAVLRLIDAMVDVREEE